MTHESPDDNPDMRATGSALREYLDEHAHSTDSVSHHLNSMDRLLADRLDGSPDGVIPEGYAIATQLLIFDAKEGKSGFDGSTMPRDVTGQPPMMYGLFHSHSIDLAREVFGETFADEVEKFYAEAEARSQGTKPDEGQFPA